MCQRASLGAEQRLRPSPQRWRKQRTRNGPQPNTRSSRPRCKSARGCLPPCSCGSPRGGPGRPWHDPFWYRLARNAVSCDVGSRTCEVDMWSTSHVRQRFRNGTKRDRAKRCFVPNDTKRDRDFRRVRVLLVPNEIVPNAVSCQTIPNEIVLWLNIC